MMALLSKRLQAIGDMVPRGQSLADIGTDHGQLLCYLAEAGLIRRGVGVELNPGPLRRARETVDASGFSAVLDIRQGDGLAPLKLGEAETVVIAGMGGGVISGILDRAKTGLEEVRRLILQPMTRAETVRYWLADHAWRIVDEEALEEGGQYYQIIKAVPGHADALTPPEACYGPLLIRARHPLLGSMVLKDFQRLQGILRQMANASSSGKYARISKQWHEKAAWMEALMEWLCWRESS
jgi:tRNA (adenine22-N1)-methyltransferase